MIIAKIAQFQPVFRIKSQSHKVHLMSIIGNKVVNDQGVDRTIKLEPYALHVHCFSLLFVSKFSPSSIPDLLLILAKYLMMRIFSRHFKASSIPEVNEADESGCGSCHWFCMRNKSIGAKVAIC